MATTIYANARFAHRADTLENWQKFNPVLKRGEPSIVTDGDDGERVKIGDGVTDWVNLPYVKGPKGDKGEKGEKGDKGEAGEKGDKGEAGEVSLTYANNSFANAVKGQRQGSIVVIDDICTIEHTVNATVTPNTQVKLSGVNLFDQSKFPRFALQADGSYKATANINTAVTVDCSIPAGSFYSIDIKCPAGCNYGPRFTYADGTSKSAKHTSNGEYKTFSGTIEKDVVSVGWVFSSISADVQFKNYCIKYGSAPNRYVPFTQPQYIQADELGTLQIPFNANGLTLDTLGQGSVIVNYNKDLNKVIEQLTNAIISLGGNI